MTFVLTTLFTFVYDHKNENHWLLLIIRYSLLITHYSEYKYPIKRLFKVLTPLRFIKSVLAGTFCQFRPVPVPAGS